MTFPCSICLSPAAREINAALLDHHQSYRAIALRFGVGRQALYRHRKAHLARELARSEEARMLVSSQSLIAELNALHTHVRRVIAHSEAAGDDRLILLGVAEGRKNIESLFKVGALAELAAQLDAGETRLQEAIARQRQIQRGTLIPAAIVEQGDHRSGRDPEAGDIDDDRSGADDGRGDGVNAEATCDADRG